MKKIKRLLTLLMAVGCMVFGAKSIPAEPTPIKIVQPDGKELTLKLIGDEFANITITTDGYALAYNNNSGAWEYAKALESGGYEATGITAHDPAHRTAKEANYVKEFGEIGDLRKAGGSGQSELRNDFQQLRSTGSEKAPLFDYSKFLGLIILVEYNDCPFSRSDVREIFDQIANKENFDGFMSTGQNPEKIKYTGSVRDYYYDNSGGMFSPRFDVVGPVKIDYSMTYAQKRSRARVLVNAALQAADSIVDFTKYDSNNDGKVDVVYLIFSGGGSNFSGNDQSLIWPHSASILGQSYDGMSFGRYACSTELYGAPANKIIDGIGTICHEFSHTLGLKDLYDTDFAGSGGESNHPERWSVMSGGVYNNYARTPTGYTIFERSELGFAKPLEIPVTKGIKLQPLNISNSGFIIHSTFEKEYFLLENRQKVKWDRYLPGHGMMIYRVDKSNMTMWIVNRVNCDPAHNYFEIVRANPKYTSNTTIVASAGDPFPGSGNVTSISGESTPGLRTWIGMPTSAELTNIAENSDKSITFNFSKPEIPIYSENFMASDLPEGYPETYQGDLCLWQFNNVRILELNNDGRIFRGAEMMKNSTMTTGNFEQAVEMISFDVRNPTSNMAIIQLSHSFDNGNTWTVLNNTTGNPSSTVNIKSETTYVYRTKQLPNAIYRFTQSAGSSSEPIYLYGIKVLFDRALSGARDEISLESNANLEISSIDGLKVSLIGINSLYPVEAFNITGHKAGQGTVNGREAVISLPAKGIYVISNGGKAVKIVL